jgi:hypothetical protein
LSSIAYARIGLVSALKPTDLVAEKPIMFRATKTQFRFNSWLLLALIDKKSTFLFNRIRIREIFIA